MQSDDTLKQQLPKRYLSGSPHMGRIFLTALLKAPFRPNTALASDCIRPNSLVLQNRGISKIRLEDYKEVCGFKSGAGDTAVALSYLQTLFIPMLGEYITSSFFPLNPLGLVQISQSLELKQDFILSDPLELTCHLEKVECAPMGTKTHFLLQAVAKNELVWQGVSVYLSRSGQRRSKVKSPALENSSGQCREIISVPEDTGRRYAAVSGDCNPHHLYPVLAKMFGFKTAIAHGMWSFARVLASLENDCCFEPGMAAEVYFKRPIFLPAKTRLEIHSPISGDDARMIGFELWDEPRKTPHLKGRITLP